MGVLAALGLATGFSAGLLGIGGGMILVPLLTLVFSVQQFADAHIVHMAIATSLAIIFFTSMSSAYAHYRRRTIRWRIAWLLTPGVIVGSWVGPMIAAGLDTRYLAGFFGVFVAFSAYKMLLAVYTTRRDGAIPGVWGIAAAGLGIGTLSGLVGSGGGFITVPFLGWRGVPMHNAVATSTIMGFPIALFGTLSNIWQGADAPGLPPGSLGFIYLPALVCVAAASVLAAPLGARLAYQLNVRQLRTVFSWLLFVLAAYMLWKALTVR